tara:strand:+ start:3279 stop:3941 length:663 start_codon:yes stop_codon:yes gene_type:complete
MKNGNGVLARMSAGQAEVAKASPAVYALAPPSAESSCPVPEPTRASVIDGSKLGNSAAHVVTLKVVNGAITDQYLQIGSLAATTGGYATFGLDGKSGADDVLFDVNGQDAAGYAQTLSSFANFGGMILNGVKYFGASTAQVNTGVEYTKIDHNQNAAVVKSRSVMFDNQLNAASIADCNIPLNASQGIRILILAGETVTVELDVLAQGYTVGEYTTDMPL